MARVRSNRSRNWVCALAALLLAVGLAGSALAQTDVTTSRISGTVEGTDKAPLPGVTVEATNKDTGLKIVDVSDAKGFYRILNLPTGNYSLSATLDGFATATANNVRLLLGSTPTVNFTLQSAKISESITVTSEAPLVEVTNTTVGTTIQQEQIKNIPSAGRDFRQLVLLTPETRLESERNTLSLSGERGINTSVNVDGVDYNNAFFGGTVGAAEGRAPLSISQESIKEFSVVTNGASVEFGRSGGGFVNVITKSGTNNLRGSGFYFKQPQSLISNFPAGSRPAGASLAPADQKKDQYGGSLGGPILRDKLFYFLSYDKQKQDLTVPIVAAELDPSFFARYPVLASPPQYVQTQDGSVAFGRLDYQATEAHRFMLRGNFTKYDGVNGTSNAGTRTESYNGIEGLNAKSYVGSYTGQFSANLLDDLNLNYVNEDTPRADKGLNLPEIQVGGLRFGEVSFLPIATTTKRKAFADTATYLLDRHVVKGGVEYNETSVDQVFKGNWRGVFIFANNADFLAGKWREYRQFGGLNGLTSDQAGKAAFSQKETAFFLQDQWFVRPNLTVTAGVRLESLDNPNAPILNPNDPGPNGTLKLTGHIPDTNNELSPRLGISWAPDEKTAVRFSAGRYWSRTPALLWAQPFTSNGIQGAQLSIFATQNSSGGVIGPPTDPNAPGWGTAFTPVGVERVNFNNVTKVSTPGVFTVNPNFKNPYTNRATLGFEREILPRVSLGLDLTYADGHQLQRLTDINRVYDGTISVNGLPHYSSVRPLSAYGSVITDLSDASSHYKAATVTLQRRYADNFSLYGAVTYSKDRDNDSNERNFAGIQAEDFNNLGLNWGPSNRDQTWKVVLNGVWTTPWWGIGLSGAFRYYTGQPFTPTANSDLNNDGQSGTDRPTINGVNLGRNSERQPDFYTLDMRLSKSIRVGPTDLSIFAECFNCANKANRFISGNDQIWGTAPTPRTTFGVEDSLNVAYVPRTFQLGARFEF
ncbi:MAG TPA: TonB-dependent receptor [Thermoanaerobaculia bacterium]|nr:TonB-dependent receptor [Thermoanaerobaculia bacterium]